MLQHLFENFQGYSIFTLFGSVIQITEAILWNALSSQVTKDVGGVTSRFCYSSEADKRRKVQKDSLEPAS